MEKGHYELKIDPELEAFMPKLSDEEKEGLEKSLKANGCYNLIHVWNGTIIDGHNRYRICKENGIPFAIQEHQFADKCEVMKWMLDEQNCRRNMSVVERVETALKYKAALLEKGKQTQGRRSDLLSSVTKGSEPFDTRTEIAKLAGKDVSRSMVQQIERIFERVDEDTKEDLRKGRKKVGTVYKEMFPSAKKKATVKKEPQEISGGKSEGVHGDEDDDLLHYKYLTPIPENCDPDTDDAEELVEEVIDLCTVFSDDIRVFRHWLFRARISHENFYDIQEALRSAADAMSDHFGWHNDVTFSDGNPDEDYEEFDVVDEMIKTANAFYKEKLKDALWNLSPTHLNEDDLSAVFGSVNDTYRAALKIIQKNMDEAGKLADDSYTKRSALKDMLKACTNADDEAIDQAIEILASEEDEKFGTDQTPGKFEQTI